MICAPVVIATLDRYEHFKRCIESLAKNSWAKYTEVYVSVDCPPAEQYEEGHGMIVEYLDNRQFKEFKMLHLYFQEKNLGASGNMLFLRWKAFEKFDRVISFEDDLEVSPNYLEFMDKALEFGCYDETIYGVCGFSDWINKSKAMAGTAFKSLAYSWGCGTYRAKYEKMRNEISVEWLDGIVYNARTMFKIFARDKVLFHALLNMYCTQRHPVFFAEDGSLKPIDIVVEVYMHMNDMCVILPAVSKVRNWGMDGSGQNCGVRLGVELCKLDRDESFEFRMETNQEINRVFQHRWNWIFRKITGQSRRVLFADWLYYCCLMVMKKFGK